MPELWGWCDDRATPAAVAAASRRFRCRRGCWPVVAWVHPARASVTGVLVDGVWVQVRGRGGVNPALVLLGEALDEQE